MTDGANNPATETARPDGAAFDSSDVVADAGREPSAERTTDAVRSGAGGLPPLWKCVWRCLTNREEWEKCRTLSAAAKLLIDEDPDSELGWTLYQMQLDRWMLLVGAERRADNGTCEAQSGARSATDPKLSDRDPEGAHGSTTARGEGAGCAGVSVAGAQPVTEPVGFGAACRKLNVWVAVRCSAWLGAPVSNTL